MLGLPADGKREERAMANVITCPVSCRASAAAAAGEERSAKRTSLPWGLVRRAKLG